MTRISIYLPDPLLDELHEVAGVDGNVSHFIQEALDAKLTPTRPSGEGMKILLP